jgi:ribonuclease-3
LAACNVVGQAAVWPKTVPADFIRGIMAEPISRLEETLGHCFHSPALLLRALTHRPHTYEAHSRETSSDNEQLEFLGDAVLGFVVSARLVAAFPAYPEGRLSKLKAHLVSANHLFKTARLLGLGDYLQLGRGEEMSGGRGKRALLVDAVEAVIAALYLDGGIEAARNFVERFVIADHFEHLVPESDPLEDYKSALQETLQAAGLAPPKYTVVQERGPQHQKTFTVEVRVGGEVKAQAEGLSKKEAAQEAARLALEHFRRTLPAVTAGGTDE